MSVFVGLSAREIYERRCQDLGCRVNSALKQSLPGLPRDMDAITSLDLSMNFIGPRGVLPLLDVIRLAPCLASIDLSDQQLNASAVEDLCKTLVHHRHITHLNLSKNPLTMEVGPALMELARVNSNVETISLEKTFLQSTVLDPLRTQLAKNAAAKAAARVNTSRRAAPVADANAETPTNAPEEGEGTAAGEVPQASPPGGLKRLPAYKAKGLLSSFPSTVAMHLYDECPAPAMDSLCRLARGVFVDHEFRTDDAVAQRKLRNLYGIDGWRRLRDVCPPGATLLPPALASAPLEYPSSIPENYQWFFASLATVVSTRGALAALLCVDLPRNDTVLSSSAETGETEPQGTREVESTGADASTTATTTTAPSPYSSVFSGRVFVDGAWRYVLVDDLVPVDKGGNVLFTKPVRTAAGSCYYWPCIVEKIFAKLHGGYQWIDADILKQHQEELLKEEARATPAEQPYDDDDDKDDEARAKAALSPESRQESLWRLLGQRASHAKIMADVTGGVPLSRSLHPVEDPEHGEWWQTMADVLGPDSCSRAVAVSADAGRVRGGLRPMQTYRVRQARQLFGVRLVQLESFSFTARALSVLWSGDWSEDSSKWQEHEEVRLALRGANSTDPASTLNFGTCSNSALRSMLMSAANTKKSGTFWMSYLDFVYNFTHVHICRLLGEATKPTHQCNLRGEWNYQTAGGPLHSSTWYVNPRFRLRVREPGWFLVQVQLPDPRFQEASALNTVGFHIVRSSEFPLLPTGSEETEVVAAVATAEGNEGTDDDGASAADAASTRFIFRNQYVSAESLTFEGYINPGDDYWIIPSTYEPGKEGSFIVRIFSTSAFSVSEEPLLDHWNMLVVQDAVAITGAYGMGDRNSQLGITFDAEEPATARSALVRGPARLLPRRGEVPRGKLVVYAEVVELDDGAEMHLESSPAVEWTGEEVRAASTDTVAAASVGLIVTAARHGPDGEHRRESGPVLDGLAAGPVMAGRTASLEMAVPPSMHGATLLCCVEPPARRARVRYTLWCSRARPIAAVPLPAWTERVVETSWERGSGYFSEADNQPQVELYGLRRGGDSFTVSLEVFDCVCADPSVTLFLLHNDGRLGEAVRGRILDEQVLAQSDYVRGTSVHLQFEVEEHATMDSLLLVPQLQPAGSFGKCRITVASESGDFKLRVLSHVFRTDSITA